MPKEAKSETTEAKAEAYAALVANQDWPKIEAHFCNMTFAKSLGIRVSLADPEHPRCSVTEVRDIHLGGIGTDFVNGVVLSGMVDFAVGLTGLRHAQGMAFATSSLNVDFARPVRNGPFYALSKCNQVIGRRLFSEVVIYDLEDQPCVFGSGTVTTGIRRES